MPWMTSLQTVHRQMRMVTLFHGIVYFCNSVLLFTIDAMAINLWLSDSISVGAIATTVALCLRIFGMSHWVMWEVSALFENIGVVIDDMSMMSQPHKVTDARQAEALDAPEGRISFEHIRFHYGKDGGVIDDLSLTIEPGEKIGLVGPFGCRQDDADQCAAAVL